MSAPKLTEAEIAFLLKQPDVAVTLARFNKSQAYQTADTKSSMAYAQRCRMFERMAR